LPAWLNFNPDTRTFHAQSSAPRQPLTITVKAENELGVYALDRFTLQPG